MTERERWIVYPLLFLALGAALRDKLVDRTTTKSIICQELLVVEEQPLGREPILLAKIGRTEPASPEIPSSGQMVLNGDFEIVDRALGRTLVRVGRLESATGNKSGGFISVNGAINAAQYAYQGVPFAPALQALFPNVSIPELMQSWKQAQQSQQDQQQESQEQQKEPETNSPSEPSEEAVSAPLAEPDGNR